MKPTLQLRLGQSLTMTPQLQQAIRLLQLSTLELQQEIQQALDNNPLLEQEENDVQETSPEEPVDASQLDSSDA
ncbi:RNA polymerase factor sigma-54, partial [Aeromonas hydrophila]|nr:RNA polymerase factor sigma-54 [Aeromonas hydrophila]